MIKMRTFEQSIGALMFLIVFHAGKFLDAVRLIVGYEFPDAQVRPISPVHDDKGRICIIANNTAE